jgi:hypothetical protein
VTRNYERLIVKRKVWVETVTGMVNPTAYCKQTPSLTELKKEEPNLE